MKKYFLIIFIAFIFIFAKEVKIGIVESERIFNEYQATAVANNEFNEFVDIYRDSAATLRNNLQMLRADFESQKLVLSEDSRLRKLDEIESLTKAYNQFLQDIFGQGGKIDQKNDELMAPLLKKINETIAKIAEQEGFDVVLDLSEGVFYASSELDITNIVIDELNLEYGPVTLPTGETKKIIAIFPFREQNSEAVDEALGERMQNELYNAISAYTHKYEIISKNQVRSEMLKRGLGRNIDDGQAHTIGQFLQCDYIIIGSVSKFTTKIDYMVSLKDIKTTQEIMKKTNSVTEDIKLFETLKNDLIALLEKIE